MDLSDELHGLVCAIEANINAIMVFCYIKGVGKKAQTMKSLHILPQLLQYHILMHKHMFILLNILHVK